MMEVVSLVASVRSRQLHHTEEEELMLHHTEEEELTPQAVGAGVLADVPSLGDSRAECWAYTLKMAGVGAVAAAKALVTLVGAELRARAPSCVCALALQAAFSAASLLLIEPTRPCTADAPFPARNAGDLLLSATLLVVSTHLCELLLGAL
jgi:hypothetical protein